MQFLPAKMYFFLALFLAQSLAQLLAQLFRLSLFVFGIMCVVAAISCGWRIGNKAASYVGPILRVLFKCVAAIFFFTCLTILCGLHLVMHNGNPAIPAAVFVIASGIYIWALFQES
ncbi:hypothetical protein F4779DRAFT_401041 [Xylariaceae sp. FL0662B]|nr:hypothetical protein F4779DRAFT_401041 [Xylariaceae sp. FL0662B]